MPSFSSTRSFMRWTCRVHSAISHPETCVVRFISCFRFVRAYLVVGLDVQLDLFAGEGADSRRIGQLSCGFAFGEVRCMGGIYLICMVGKAVVVVCFWI